MNKKIKSTLIYIFQPRAIVFYVALLNFIAFWHESHRMGGACVVCPWFYPWSYNNEPSVILAAATSLLIKRWWSYIISVVLSGYLIGYFLHIFMFIDMTIYEDFRRLSDPRTDIVTDWDTQYFLALIILIFSLFSLGGVYYKKVIRKVYL